jgi:antitoxin component YwqK of YwqJK toxin-antitoxin module
MSKLDLLCFVAFKKDENLIVKESAGNRIACRNENFSFAAAIESTGDSCLWLNRNTNSGIMKEFYPSGNLYKLYQIKDGKVTGEYKVFSEDGNLIHSYYYNENVLKITFF